MAAIDTSRDRSFPALSLIETKNRRTFELYKRLVKAEFPTAEIEDRRREFQDLLVTEQIHCPQEMIRYHYYVDVAKNGVQLLFERDRDVRVIAASIHLAFGGNPTKFLQNGALNVLRLFRKDPNHEKYLSEVLNKKVIVRLFSADPLMTPFVYKKINDTHHSLIEALPARSVHRRIIQLSKDLMYGHPKKEMREFAVGEFSRLLFKHNAIFRNVGPMSPKYAGYFAIFREVFHAIYANTVGSRFTTENTHNFYFDTISLIEASVANISPWNRAKALNEGISQLIKQSNSYLTYTEIGKEDRMAKYRIDIIRLRQALPAEVTRPQSCFESILECITQDSTRFLPRIHE